VRAFFKKVENAGLFAWGTTHYILAQVFPALAPKRRQVRFTPPIRLQVVDGLSGSAIEGMTVNLRWECIPHSSFFHGVWSLVREEQSKSDSDGFVAVGAYEDDKLTDSYIRVSGFGAHKNQRKAVFCLEFSPFSSEVQSKNRGKGSTMEVQKDGSIVVRSWLWGDGNDPA